MSYWQEHIAQLKVLLQNFQQEIAPYWDKESHKEKKAQLQSIEKTITNLQKNNTSIPDDLRELKFKLLKELDQFKDAEAAKAELHELLAPFLLGGNKQATKSKLSKRVVKRPRKYEEPTVEIKDLIEAGYLSEGAVLTRLYKGVVYRAVITPERKIQLIDHANQEHFDTPSGAAVAASGKSQNGWTWWGIEGQGKDITLDHYRQKLIKQK
jgi:hypothetical protein